MDAWSAPQHVLLGDPLDERDGLTVYLGPAGQGARLPAPVAAKALSVPTKKCCRRHQQRQPGVFRPEPVQPHQKPAVGIVQVQSLRSLAAKHKIFMT